MKKYLFIAFALFALCSCEKKEKEVTYDHPLAAEFGADGGHKTDAVLYANLSMMNGDEISALIAANPADLVLVQLPSSIGTEDVEIWMESKRAGWGYSVSGYVKETSFVIAALSKLNTATFDSYSMSDTKALQTIYGDYLFLVGAPTENDLKAVADKVAKTSEKDVLFFFQLDAPSEDIKGMVYTDCIEAQFGATAFPARTDYLYAAPGVWNKMGAIAMNPVRFTIFSEEK